MNWPENISRTICKICFALICLSYVAQCKEPTLIWYSGSISDSREVALEDAHLILNTKYCNSTHPVTIIYTGGFAQRAYGSEVQSVIKEILKAFPNYAVALYQWDDAANTYLNYVLDIFNITTIGANYPLVVLASRQAFEALGKALYSLYKAGLDLIKVYLVGHSLGAHGMGHACRVLKNCTGGLTVYQLSLLDSASYAFESPLKVFEPAGKDCATRVLSLHTDRLHYGTREYNGHVNIVVNKECYDQNKRQPWCPDHPKPFSKEDFCSHKHSVQIFKKTINYPTVFEAHLANADGSCSGTSQNQAKIYVGLNIDTTADGVYCMCTNTTFPYTTEGLYPAQC